VEIDGSVGEGGGQALRSSLALSLVTGRPLRMKNIRSRRPRPGLMRQHLTAVEAAATIGHAVVDGASIGSQTLDFTPSTLVGGEHRFSIGTAGSTTLVLQTILPALLRAPSASSVVVEGGTHNPLAPPFEFLESVYLPILRRMGATVEARLERHGFAPSGGGRIRLEVEPSVLTPISILERGAATGHRITALLSALPFDVARRELEVARGGLGWDASVCSPFVVKDAAGPGNVLEIALGFEHATELITAFGERGVLAETVATAAVNEAKEYLASTAPVGRHLADQLLVPFALAGGGSFVSLSPTPHFETQCAVVSLFLDVEIRRTQLDNTCRFDVGLR